MIKIKGKLNFIFISLDFDITQKAIKKEPDVLSPEGDYNKLFQGIQFSKSNLSLNNNR